MNRSDRTDHSLLLGAVEIEPAEDDDELVLPRATETPGEPPAVSHGVRARTQLPALGRDPSPIRKAGRDIVRILVGELPRKGGRHIELVVSLASFGSAVLEMVSVRDGEVVSVAPHIRPEDIAEIRRVLDLLEEEARAQRAAHRRVG